MRRRASRGASRRRFARTPRSPYPTAAVSSSTATTTTRPIMSSSSARAPPTRCVSSGPTTTRLVAHGCACTAPLPEDPMESTFVAPPKPEISYPNLFARSSAANIARARMASPTALAALARTAIDAARAFDVSEDALAEALREARIEPSIVSDPDGRVAVADLLRLWELLADRSNDRFFGLHAGETVVSARTIHVVGYAARNSSSVGECYAHTVRFASLTNEGSEITSTLDAQRGTLVVGPRPGLP